MLFAVPPLLSSLNVLEENPTQSYNGATETGYSNHSFPCLSLESTPAQCVYRTRTIAGSLLHLDCRDLSLIDHTM